MEQTIPTFSIEALLQAAGVAEDNDFTSIRMFLEWANVNQNTLQFSELEKLQKQYKAEINDKFTLGLYEPKILEAAKHWVNKGGNAKEVQSSKKRKQDEEQDEILKRPKTSIVPLTSFPAPTQVIETLVYSLQNKVKKQDTANVHNIPLQERSEQLQRVVTIVAENLNKIVKPEQQISNNAKTDCIIPTFTGGAGVGKVKDCIQVYEFFQTTLAYESAQELFRKWKDIAPKQYQDAKLLYFMIDFARGGKLMCIEKALSPSVIVGLRLAYAYFLGEYEVIFPEFVQFCGASLECFTIISVLEAIRNDLKLKGDDKLFIVLHLDGVQHVFGFEKAYTYPASKGLFKSLMYQICSYLNLGKSTIQPFVSGTAHQKVMKSKEACMHTFEFIDAPLLSFEAVLNLIQHYATQCGAHPWEWKMQLPFLQLVGDMGGLPRVISYLLEECFGKNFSQDSDQVQGFFEKISTISFFPIFTRIADVVSRKYGIEGFVSTNKQAVLQILHHAIRNISVTRDMVFGDTTIEQMEQEGHIFLHRVGTDYYFQMPFLFVFIYNRYLRIIPHELAEAVYHDNKVGWESFNALFQVFVNNMYLLMKTNLQMRLGDFYSMAYGTDETKNLEFMLEPLEMVPVVHRFPSKNHKVVHKDTGKEINWNTHGYLLLNEFGDTVLIRGVANSKAANKYFRRKVKTIIICQKWYYSGEDFTLEQVLKEHNKATETAENEGLPNSCGLITVIFTTQQLPRDKIKIIPKNILVVHQDNFKDYYGPFATRAEISAAFKWNPNLADIQHLKVLHGVGEETAKEIAEERQKKPFTSVDDLCNRVNRIKKTDQLTRQLTLFPFDSDRFPFEGYTKQKE